MTVAELREWLRTFEGCQDLPIAAKWEGQIILLSQERVYKYRMQKYTYDGRVIGKGEPIVLIDADIVPD